MGNLTKSQAKKKAWAAFSKYIRARDAYRTTGFEENAICVTCGKMYPTTGRGCIQAGHFIPGRSNGALFEEKGVHAQCYGCNGYGRGKQHIYQKFMLETYGNKVILELYEKAREVIQYKVHDYLEIEKKYKKKLKELREKA